MVSASNGDLKWPPGSYSLIPCQNVYERVELEKWGDMASRGERY